MGFDQAKWRFFHILPSGKHLHNYERSTIFHEKFHYFDGDFP